LKLGRKYHKTPAPGIHLERELRAELYPASVPVRDRLSSEAISGVPVGLRIRITVAVEEVKELSTELEPHAFLDPGVLDDAEVFVVVRVYSSVQYRGSIPEELRRVSVVSPVSRI
jgi:hypothetical protein